MTTILRAYAHSPTREFAVAEARLREASLLVLASERHADPRKARGVKDHRPLAERLAETGLDVELRTVARRAQPADDILAAIEEKGAELVVIGMRRRTSIGKRSEERRVGKDGEAR